MCLLRFFLLKLIFLNQCNLTNFLILRTSIYIHRQTLVWMTSQKFGASIMKLHKNDIYLKNWNSNITYACKSSLFFLNWFLFILILFSASYFNDHELWQSYCSWQRKSYGVWLAKGITEGQRQYVQCFGEKCQK